MSLLPNRSVLVRSAYYSTRSSLKFRFYNEGMRVVDTLEHHNDDQRYMIAPVLQYTRHQKMISSR